MTLSLLQAGLALYAVLMTIIAVYLFRDLAEQQHSELMLKEVFKDEVQFLREENGRLHERLLVATNPSLTLIPDVKIMQLTPTDPLAIKDKDGTIIGNKGANVI